MPTNDDEEITDLEAFHCMQMARLGLGAKPVSAKSDISAALANPNTAEGKLARLLLNGTKKRPAEDDTAPSTSSETQKNNKQVLTRKDDDDESRSSAISAKVPKLAKSNSFFHDNPVRSDTQPSKKPRSLNVDAQLPLSSAEAVEESVTKAEPSKPNASGSTSPYAPPYSPTRLEDVRPPYAIPPDLLDKADDASPKQDPEGAAPGTESPSKARKRKRKKNKQTETSTPA
ncbi:hypothetical protein EMMF5_001651 [Cystobasidiomycetes sp. EMM_F5]